MCIYFATNDQIVCRVCRNFSVDVYAVTEIYRIVSQKQIQDGSGGDAHTPSNNVQTITVAPTTSAGEQKKSCCN